MVGLLVVRWGVQGLIALAPANLPRLQDVAPDWTVLLVTLGVAVVTGTLVGLVPAIFAGRADVRPALQDSNRGTVGSRSRHRMRTALVVTELALAVVLTVGAGLLLRSFNSVMTLDPGFRPEHLLTMQMTLPARVDHARGATGLLRAVVRAAGGAARRHRRWAARPASRSAAPA